MRETDAFCTYKGNKICDGAVTKEYKTMVQLCENGGLRYKKLEKVKPGYPLAGNGIVLKIHMRVFSKIWNSQEKYFRLRVV